LLLQTYPVTELEPLPTVRPTKQRYTGESEIRSLLAVSYGQLLCQLDALDGRDDGTYDLKPDSAYASLHPDFVFGKFPTGGAGRGMVLALVEVKTPIAFPMPDGGDLVGAFNREQLLLQASDDDDSSIDGAASDTPYRRIELTAKNDSKVSRAICQLWGYLTVNHLRYGVLTTFNETYFIMRTEHPDEPRKSRMMISPCIHVDPDKNDNLTLFASWLYLIHLANADRLYSSPYTTPTLTRKMMLQNKDRYAVSKISLSDLKFTHQTTLRHRSALAADIGNDTRVVVKLFEVEKSDEYLDQFNTEVAVYRRLESLQGSTIPRFLGCFRASGYFMGIALEPCGLQMRNDQVSERIDDIKAALTKIHDLGVVHGDIATRNVLIDDNNDVRIIDFDRAGVRDADADAHLWKRRIRDDLKAIDQLLHDD
jgi:hypothetical protein